MMTRTGGRRWLAVGMVVLLVVGVMLVACSRGGSGTPAPVSTPKVTASPTPTAAPTVVLPPGFANLAALSGLRCVGRWQNTTFGSSGAFAARLEAGGGGGLISLEVGGNVFGSGGGTFDAPFQLVGQALEINAHSTFLGHMEAKIGLDGKATGSLSGVPALGPKSQVTVTQYSMGADRMLRFTLRIDWGDGRPPATSTVEAACSK